MEKLNDVNTETLLGRIADGDQSAVDRLLGEHRVRLRRMVATRMNARFSARCDGSDIVQDALMEASRRLPEYIERPEIPFYPWLRRLAWQRLVDQFRHHVVASCRSIDREQPGNMPLPDQSSIQLLDRLMTSGTSPSGGMRRDEVRRRVRKSLDKLAPYDREVLVLRYLEQLSNREIAAVLDITERTVQSRHRRGLMRLTKLLGEDPREED